MKDNFALAVENSTASFIEKGKIISGKAENVFQPLFSSTENIVILCYDHGWFEAGRMIKESLKNFSVTSFCIDDTPDFEKVSFSLLDSIQKIDAIITIGSENLALTAFQYLSKKGGKLFYLPMDMDFTHYFIKVLERENSFLVLDENLLSRCGKNKLTDGVRYVFSKKIIRVETCVNEVIGGLYHSNEVETPLNSALLLLDGYLQTHEISKLVCSLLLSSIAEQRSKVGNVGCSASEILLRLQKLSLRGEAEYLFYKMILRSYDLYLKNDLSFTLSLPGQVTEEEEIKRLFQNSSEERLCDLPYFFNDLKEVERLKKAIIADGRVLPMISELLAQINGEEEILKREYGGRKYTIEHYNAKQRSKALILSPYITSKPTLYHLLFASGFTQYFKGASSL